MAVDTQIDYKNLTEETLFNRYTGGDTKAFEEILKRTKGLVYSLILSYERNHAMADEIFQEVFLKLCRKKDLFRESVSFKAWLMTICRNTCIDHRRKQGRRLNPYSLDQRDDDNKSLSDVVADTNPLQDEHVNTQLESQELKDLLGELPDEQKETFYSKVMMDMTFEEIGQAMGCSSNTAKSRYRYALESLRSLVRRKRFLEQAV